MPLVRHAPFALLPFVLAATVARAQVDASVDAGAAHLRQFNFPQSPVFPVLPRADVGTVGGRLRWDGLRASLTSSGVSAFTADGAYTIQGFFSGSVYAEPLLPRRWEFGVSASGFGGSSVLPTTGGQLFAREHFIGDRVGAFVGVSGGGLVLDRQWRHAVTAQVGGWWRLERGVLSGVVNTTDTRSLLRIPIPDFPTFFETHSATYIDAATFWQGGWDRLELELGSGIRGNVRGVKASSLWGSASAVFWLAPRVGIVVTRGRALEDIARGLPEAQYLTAAIRIGMHDHYAAQAPGAPPRIDTPLLSSTRADTGNRHVITVRVPSATTVEIMGDFTDWEPVSLVRMGAGWQVERELPQGAHRVAVRVDGGPWMAPSNLPHVTDDLAGTVGLLSVP